MGAMRYALLAFLTAALGSAQTFPLWPGETFTEAERPELTVYKAARANGSGVLICPGGGYQYLAMDHEGKQIAEWFNAMGVSAFVLKYRLGPKYHNPAMLDDARRGMRMIREKAGEFGVDPHKVGVIGFSAGGHLASTLSTHFQTADERPDFSVLVYPVISLSTKYAHKGSRTNLLGENPDPRLVEELSNEHAVTMATPPTFLFHTDDDDVVPVMNSILYFQALKAAGVRGEMHIYAHGRHGVGLAQTDPVLSTWPDRLRDWLVGEGLVAKR